MQWAQGRVLFVVELFCHEHSLVTGKRYRFWKARAVHIVHRSPWSVHPVGASLDDVVLEIVLVEQQHSLFGGSQCEVAFPLPVP